MADDLEDSGQWRHSVETRLGSLEARVEQEAGLRAAMDRDMGDLKAGFRVQLKLIEAISRTQSEHTAQLRELRQDVQGLREGQQGLRQDVQSLREGQQSLREDMQDLREKVLVGVELINHKLDRLVTGET